MSLQTLVQQMSPARFQRSEAAFVAAVMKKWTQANIQIFKLPAGPTEPEIEEAISPTLAAEHDDSLDLEGLSLEERENCERRILRERMYKSSRRDNANGDCAAAALNGEEMEHPGDALTWHPEWEPPLQPLYESKVFQKTGVSFLHRCRREYGVAFLADEMGVGKLNILYSKITER